MSFLGAWSSLPIDSPLRLLIQRLNTLLGDRRIVAPNGLGMAIRTITAARTLDGTDGVVLADATGAAFTVTLPRADQSKGRWFRVMKTDASANAVTVATLQGNINGAATKVLAAQFAAADLHSDGANWFHLA